MEFRPCPTTRARYISRVKYIGFTQGRFTSREEMQEISCIQNIVARFFNNSTHLSNYVYACLKMVNRSRMHKKVISREDFREMEIFVWKL